MKKLGLIALFGVMMLEAYAAAPAAKILLKPNQQMVDITLAANATTGYQWFVQNYDHDLLSLQNYRYVKNANANGKVGSGGVAIFSFAVDPRFYDAPQTTSVNLVYQQAWNPGQNASPVQVAISATASSNDLSNWQKYPQLAGPAAEVQASESEIYAQDQAATKPAVAPVPMVTLPGSSAASQASPALANTSKAASSGVTPVAQAQSAPVSSPNNATLQQPVTPNNNGSINNLNSDQVLPAGQPTPNTDSQSQWLSLPAAASTTSTPATKAPATPASAATNATPATTSNNANK